jgi:hypothetical protein
MAAITDFVVLGITLLISRGVRLLTASGDDLTASDDPTRKMMRRIAGTFAEYGKARLVSKLLHARERVRHEKEKCEGCKPHVEVAGWRHCATGDGGAAGVFTTARLFRVRLSDMA